MATPPILAVDLYHLCHNLQNNAPLTPAENKDLDYMLLCCPSFLPSPQELLFGLILFR